MPRNVIEIPDGSELTNCDWRRESFYKGRNIQLLIGSLENGHLVPDNSIDVVIEPLHMRVLKEPGLRYQVAM